MVTLRNHSIIWAANIGRVFNQFPPGRDVRLQNSVLMKEAVPGAIGEGDPMRMAGVYWEVNDKSRRYQYGSVPASGR